jgi:hypothetical protein
MRVSPLRRRCTPPLDFAQGRDDRVSLGWSIYGVGWVMKVLAHWRKNFMLGASVWPPSC